MYVYRGCLERTVAVFFPKVNNDFRILNYRTSQLYYGGAVIVFVVLFSWSVRRLAYDFVIDFANLG